MADLEPVAADRALEPVDRALEPALAPVLAFLPAVLEYVDSTRMVYDYPKFWLCCGRTWNEMTTKDIREVMTDALEMIIQRLPDEERAIAKAQTSRKALREPLLAPFRLAIARRPFVEWNTEGRIAYKDKGNYHLFDFETGMTRLIEPTDYIRVMLGAFPPPYRALDAAKREAVRAWAEDMEFLISAVAHAMIGRPVERFYVVCGEHAHALMVVIQHILHMAYACRIDYHDRHRISYPYPHRWTIERIIRSRIGIMDGVDGGDPKILHDLTDGTGRITFPLRTGETATYAQRCTLFCTVKNVRSNIRDNLLTARMVFIPVREVTSEMISWGRSHDEDIFAYLCERATDIYATGRPPPIPPFIHSMTWMTQDVWRVLTVEEWMVRMILPQEGTLQKSKAYDLYIFMRRNSPPVEIVTQKMFYHLLEQHIGQKPTRGVFTGWVTKIEPPRVDVDL
jgi:hypothetical protein